MSDSTSWLVHKDKPDWKFKVHAHGEIEVENGMDDADMTEKDHLEVMLFTMQIFKELQERGYVK